MLTHLQMINVSTLSVNHYPIEHILSKYFETALIFVIVLRLFEEKINNALTWHLAASAGASISGIFGSM
jgi:hypothetical protein